jgi:hypothetical protein
VGGGDAEGDEAVVGLASSIACGRRVEGGGVADAVVAAEEAERGAAGALVDGEAGERDGGGAVARGRLDEQVAPRAARGAARAPAPGSGRRWRRRCVGPAGEGQQAVEGGLQQGAAAALEVEELLGPVGGGERPEALALAAGHDDGGDGEQEGEVQIGEPGTAEAQRVEVEQALQPGAGPDRVAGQVEDRQAGERRERRRGGELVAGQPELLERPDRRQRRRVRDLVLAQVQHPQYRQSLEGRNVGHEVAPQFQRRQRRQGAQRREVGEPVAAQVGVRQAREARERREVGDLVVADVEAVEVDGVLDAVEQDDAGGVGVDPADGRHRRAGDAARRLVQRDPDGGLQAGVGDGDLGAGVAAGDELGRDRHGRRAQERRDEDGARQGSGQRGHVGILMPCRDFLRGGPRGVGRAAAQRRDGKTPCVQT